MMKKIYLIVFIVLAVIQVKAQFVYDEWDEIIPFTLTEEYGHFIDTSKINTIMLPCFNNDSLFWANNPPDIFKKWNTGIASGFDIDSIVDFFSTATKFEIPIGTIWLLKIESPTAEKIGLHIPLPNLAKNGLLSFFSYNMDQHGTYPECYDNERLRTEEKLRKFKEINADCYGNHLIMEYFQPKGISKNPEIRIDKFVYLYYDGFGIKKKASDNYRE